MMGGKHSWLGFFAPATCGVAHSAECHHVWTEKRHLCFEFCHLHVHCASNMPNLTPAFGWFKLDRIFWSKRQFITFLVIQYHLVILKNINYCKSLEECKNIARCCIHQFNAHGLIGSPAWYSKAAWCCTYHARGLEVGLGFVALLHRVLPQLCFHTYFARKTGCIVWCETAFCIKLSLNGTPLN